MKRLLPLLLAAVAAPAWAAPDALTADLSAQGVQQFALQAGGGQVHITASADDAIHVKLVLRQEEHSFIGLFHWMSADSADDLEGAKLHTTSQAGSLALTLAYPSGGSHSDVKQEWTLSVPARLAASVHMEAGMLSIKGLSGGVTTQLGAGYTDIRIPKGPVHARQSAGRLSVISDDTQPGSVHVHSTFGLAVLSLDGKYYGPPEQHGFWSSLHFFGNSVEQKGAGKDEIVLEETAGLASVRIGPVGDFKDYRGAFTDED